MFFIKDANDLNKKIIQNYIMMHYNINKKEKEQVKLIFYQHLQHWKIIR